MPSPLLRVALTGGIATGKSYCLRRFAALGAPVIDADAVSRQVLAPGTPGLEAVVKQFGSDIVAYGSLNRSELARIVFQDPAARAALEAIVHPSVYAAIEAWFTRLAESGDAKVGIADIPLLYETRREGDFHRVVVAACSVDHQLTRVMSRDGVLEVDARRRLATQLPIDDKRARADYVIDTDGSPTDTDVAVADVLRKLNDEAAARR